MTLRLIPTTIWNKSRNYYIDMLTFLSSVFAASKKHVDVLSSQLDSKLLLNVKKTSEYTSSTFNSNSESSRVNQDSQSDDSIAIQPFGLVNDGFLGALIYIYIIWPKICT